MAVDIEHEDYRCPACGAGWQQEWAATMPVHGRWDRCGCAAGPMVPPATLAGACAAAGWGLRRLDAAGGEAGVLVADDGMALVCSGCGAWEGLPAGLGAGGVARFALLWERRHRACGA